MNHLKGLMLVLLVGLVQACSFLQPHSMAYPEPSNPQLKEALATEAWIRDEYGIYQSRRGYKAFAIAVSAPDFILATGWADDKVSRHAAYNEAVRMCRYYSRGEGQCRVVDEQASNGTPGLTKQQIDAAPKELIAHRDIVQYVNYQKAKPPKAFVIAAFSGQTFWLAQQTNQKQAEQRAMEKCEIKRHDADPFCTVLKSE